VLEEKAAEPFARRVEPRRRVEATDERQEDP
jgi:hypothetical protein